MRNSVVIAMASLVLLIAGCSQEATKAPEVKPQEPQASAPATPQPAATDQKPQQTANDTESVTNNACVAAAKKETGESSISVVSNEFSEANTLVMLEVGAQKAPWRCLVSSDGAVAELSFQGNDGDGVAEAQQTASDVSQKAIDACLGAVSGQTGNADVKVLSSEFSEANSTVTVGVGEKLAPWRCLVSNDGAVQEVMSQTDEGNL